MFGFAKFESASQFCNAFDELRNYLGVRFVGGDMYQHLVGERFSPKDCRLSWPRCQLKYRDRRCF